MTETRERGQGVGEVCVLFACHSVVCALPARFIERLLLLDEVRLLDGHDPRSPQEKASQGARISLGGHRVVEAAGQRLAAWDFGEMVELPSLAAAWVLTSVPHRSGSVPLALRTGPCLVVAKLRETTPLPPGIFRARPAAFPACFAVESILARSADWIAGLLIDPRALFTSAELDLSLGTLGMNPDSSAALAEETP